MMIEQTHFCFVMPFHMSERSGGAEVQAGLFAKELVRRGHRVTYIAPSVEGKAGSESTVDGVDVYWISDRKYFDIFNAPAYFRRLLRLRPTVIIQRATSFQTGVLSVYKTLTAARFVWICTDDMIPFRWQVTKKTWKALQKNPLAGRITRIPFLIQAAMTDLFRGFGIRRADVCFTQNDDQAKNLRRNFGRSSRRIFPGHEPIVAPPDLETRWREKTVLWAGNLGSRKRPELFIDLSAMCHPDIRFRLLGGRGEREGFRKKLVSAGPNLEWKGHIPFGENLLWFDRASLFVNTTEQGKEGFPNTFIQAWLRGIPVLSLEVDPDGVIAKNELGYVTGNLERMKELIEKFLSDFELYQTFSRRVRAFAEERFLISRAVDDFMSKLGIS